MNNERERERCHPEHSDNKVFCARKINECLLIMTEVFVKVNRDELDKECTACVFW